MPQSDEHPEYLYLNPMQNPIDELRELVRVYGAFEHELSNALQGSSSESGQSLPDRILEKRTGLTQVEQMGARVQWFSEELKKFRSGDDAEMLQEADMLLEEARSHVIRINELCSQAAEMIEPIRNALRKDIQEIAKGKQYLKSVVPIKNNYPKFIDSTG